MAIASDFLKRKAAEQSSSVQQSTAGKASSFLERKVAEEAKKYAGVGQQLMPQLLQDIQSLAIPEVKQQDGYYSRPVVDTAPVEDISKRLEKLNIAMQYGEHPVKEAEKAVTTASSALISTAAALKSAYEAYGTAPEQRTARVYNQALAAYKKAQSDYDAAYSAYKNAYDTYRKNADTYQQIHSAWENYVNQSKASYDAWKGTIRDAATIKAELETVDAQLEELEKQGRYGKLVRDKTNGKTVYNTLRDRRALLQEEYDWAAYGDMMDIKNTPYFGTLSENERLMVIDMTTINNMSEQEYERMVKWWHSGRNNPEEVVQWAEAYGIDRLKELQNSFRRYQNEQQARETVQKAQDAVNNMLGWTKAYGVARLLNLDRYNGDRAAMQAQQDAVDFVGKLMGGTAASLATIPGGIANALQSPLALGQELLWYDDRYGNLDPNGPGFQLGMWNSTVRDTVAENIRGDKYDEDGNLIKDGGLLGNVGATLYGAGMSTMDNLARLAIGLATGGGSAVTLGLAAMGSFGDTVRQISAQGGSPVQALAMGVISGGLEVITEKVSLDNLLKGTGGDPLNAKNLIKTIFVQGGVEVSEEEINFIASTIAEAAIMQEKSAYNQQVQQLMAQGLSETEARERANWGLLEQAVQIAAESFLSGGMMAGAVSTVNKGKVDQAGKDLGLGEITKDSAQAIIDEGLLCGKDTDAYNMALKLQKKLEAGKLLTAGELYQQLAANQEAIAAEDEQPSSIKDQLRANKDSLNAMEPVKSITVPTNYYKMSLAEKMNWVIEKLRPTNYEADRRGFGIIKFSGKQIKSAFNYFAKGGIEEATFEAIPYILEQGIEIANKRQHKDRGYGTVTFAAPVLIDGKRGNMAVVVKKTTENFYKVHRVLTPDGSVFNLVEETETEPTPAGESPKNGSLATPISSVPNPIIDQGGGVVNNNNQNGGNGNANTDEQAGAGSTDAGTGVLYGGSQRDAGTGAGEQAGGVDSRAETAEKRKAADAAGSRGKAAVDRRSLARRLGLQKVSSRDIGLNAGTENRNLQVLPQEHWDTELQQLGQKIREETGREPVMVVGEIRVTDDDGKSYPIRAAITDTQVILRADYSRIPLEKIVDHEIYHYKRQLAGAQGLDLNDLVASGIFDNFTDEEIRNVLQSYIDALGGQFGLTKAAAENDENAIAKAKARIIEEMLADAYAGINAFGANAQRFTEVVNERMDSIGMGRGMMQENGVRQTNGPNKNTAQTDGEWYSMDDGSKHKIYPGMDDGQRAEILMQKMFCAPVYDNNDSVTGAQIIKLKGKYVTAARKLLSGLAEQCGDFHIDLYNADINLSFQYSNKSLKESINKQSKRGGTAETFGKMLTVLPEICESAVEIETHTDRYVETAREDNHLREMHVLVGAFMDGDDCIPVQLEIKEYLPATGMNNKLYVTVTMKNEAGVTPRGSTAVSASVSVRSRPASIISLADLIANVKDDTGDLVKYIPDQMLTDEQCEKKKDALARDEKRIRDMRYEFAVQQGNDEKALKMLNEQAERAGYSASDDWRMAHRAPDRNSGVTIDNADEVYGGDGSIRSPLAHRYYGEGRDYDVKAIMTLRKAWRDPDGSIKVYRAVPSDVKDDRLRNGDWVSPTKEYAQEHGERYFENGFRIIEQDVPVQHLYLDGNSIHEFGYDNGRTTEVYKNTPNNVKLTEITYDDNGELIPISQRFDDSVSDERYSADDAEEEQSGGQYLLDEEAFHRIKAEAEAKGRQSYRDFLRQELGEEGVAQYRATEQVVNARKKAEQVTRSQESRKQAGETELDVEVRATQAKAILEKKLLDLFNIPDGQRAQTRAYIGGFADRIIKHGALTESDRQIFFQRMYETGAVTIPAEDYYAEARSYIKGGHIYVPDSVVAEFGDDWQDVRRRAFSAGIYLTRERTGKDGHSIAGIDVWNDDLAHQMPGMFSTEDTDQTAMLERIIHVAELGRDEKISLAEYVARIANEEYRSSDEVLETMERQMLWALRSFAETAQVEIQLKERNLRRVMKERQENVERARLAKERKELQELQQKTLKSLQWLAKNRHRAPEELRSEWEQAISDIDLYAVGAANELNYSNKYEATWKDLAQMYKEARATDPNFHEDKEIERIISRLDDKKIADMDPAALTDLYKLAVGLRTAFYNRNNVISDEMHRIFEEVYTEAKDELTAAGKDKHGLVDRFMNLEQLSAMNVLQQMAGWNPDSAWYSMAKQLERGERDVRAFTVKANRILEQFLTEHKEWVMKADGQSEDAIWYTVEVPELMEWGKGNKPIFGPTVTVYMTPAQKVHMYLESKNRDNLRHMEGGRTFVVDKELYGQGKRQEALANGRTIRLAPETVKQLVSYLTPEEMELASVLNQYYNSFATEHINRVSNILYGYDKAMGKNYAPIYTNQNYTMAEFGNFDVTAEGVGNLKGRVQYSKNPSYNISAFDAFERNVNQTARFVGMAIPLRNWTTLMNWTEYKNSMKDVIDHSWGLEYHQYIDNLLIDLQGGKLDREDVISEKAEQLMSNYISSVFGFNMSIVLKQMGSIPLAGAYLGIGNVMPSRGQIARLDPSLIHKYTQDLAWRSMGYSMPETKQLKDHPNWTQRNKAARFLIGGGAITAMDTWAASTLWPWAENKVRKEHPELEVGTQEQIENGESPFYRKVAEEFENAVARSQSTSDQMHQGRLRKSKKSSARMFTMFTSDSAQTYNALRQMLGEARYYKESGQEKKAHGQKKAAGAVLGALLLNSIWGEAVNLIAALIKNKGKRYRDEEEEMTAASVFEEMFAGMLSTLSGTVVGGDMLVELLSSKLRGEKYYAPEAMDVSIIQDILMLGDTIIGNVAGVISGVADVVADGGDLWQYIKTNGNDILGQIKDAALEAASYTGVPAANMEAYIFGLLKFIPGFGAIYDGIFESADKNSLAGLSGINLEMRIGDVMELRGVVVSDEVTKAMAALYESGYKGAIPSGVPGSVSIDNEKREMDTAQQQFYGRVWADTVEKHLQTVVTSDRFADASKAIQEAMLKKLYSYAAEQAKAEVFADYKAGGTKDDIAAYEQAGMSVADYFAVKAEGHNSDHYLEAVASGLPVADADDLMDNIDALKPEVGEDRVENVQRWRACVNMFGNSAHQLAALAAYMTPDQLKKAKLADDVGVDLSNYVRLYEIRTEYDENGNKSFSGAEYKKAIDSMHLSKQESALLWQLATGSKSAKNNPYSSSVGQKVIDAME